MKTKVFFNIEKKVLSLFALYTIQPRLNASADFPLFFLIFTFSPNYVLHYFYVEFFYRCFFLSINSMGWKMRRVKIICVTWEKTFDLGLNSLVCGHLKLTRNRFWDISMNVVQYFFFYQSKLRRTVNVWRCSIYPCECGTYIPLFHICLSHFPFLKRNPFNVYKMGKLF